MTAVQPIAPDQTGATITPPGPRGLPILGHILDIARDAVGYLERCAQTYGDVTRLQLGAYPALLINEADLLEQIYVKQHEKFIKNRVFWRQLRALLGNGLFVAEHEDWRRERHFAAPAFATRPLQAYAPAMVAEAERRVAGWRDGQEIDMHREMMALGLMIAARTLLNADVTGDLPGIEQGVDWVMDEIAARYARPILIPDAVPLPGHIRYRKGIKALEALIYRIIEDQRAGRSAPEGLIGQLMGARDETGRPMSDVQLRDAICNMLLAGYETSALTMAWGFDLLGRERDIQDQIAAEVRDVIGDRTPTHEDLPALKLTENAIIEILRLRPPGWMIGREAIEDTRIGNYDIPKGMTLLTSPWVTQRDPRYFDDPQAFRPERWAGNLRRTLPRFAYFPFGGGPRVCIGNRFAMMEAMLLLAVIVRRFDIERMVEREAGFVPSITMRPKAGLWVRLHARG
ncbi:cytochrome P450 [Pelagibacterium limicola]|uniref:cytochrome P450 n=1 Tax=Pelagibacterium limicola TaxID=2791022 RepID=UPI0018B00525|nr:cytochrome P450 [Pelagibacterium limicola]